MGQAARRCLVVLTLAAALVAVARASVEIDSAALDIQLQLGASFLEEGRYLEALDALERAVKTDNPANRLRAHMGLVTALLRLAEFGRARTEAEVVLKARPRDAEALALYGDSLWASGLFEEAERTFGDALSVDPEQSRALHGQARSLAARNQLEQALNEAQAALRTSPRDAEIHYTVGSIYERMHRFDEAATAFSNYVNLLPNRDRSEKAAWSRAEIRFLRSFGDRKPFEMIGDNQLMLHTVPFKLIKDKVVVKARANGRSDLEFVLDTGSEQTTISNKTAEKVGVEPVVFTLSAGIGEVGLRGLQLGRLDTLEIGTLKLANVPCLIKNPPLKGIPIREPESFSPLALGLSMTIDYGKRLLTIGRSVAQEPADFELPLRLHRLAMVRGTVDGSLPANFVVDTGGEVISISTETATALGRDGAQRKIPLKVFGASGWDRDAFLMPGVNLAFEDIVFRNLPVVVLNLRTPSVLLGFQLGGIVGHGFLSKYRVGIDLDRSVLRLKALHPAPTLAGS
jgi:tetratricopeptide (TPR) repeat protein